MDTVLCCVDRLESSRKRRSCRTLEYRQPISTEEFIARSRYQPILTPTAVELAREAIGRELDFDGFRILPGDRLEDWVQGTACFDCEFDYIEFEINRLATERGLRKITTQSTESAEELARMLAVANERRVQDCGE